jgi:hypothetical protein
MSVRSGYCNLGGNFGAGCIPAQIEGADPFAQDKGSYDPNKGPLLNKAAFEPSTNFNFYWGTGPRVSNFRGFGYRNFDLGVVKDTPITEKVKLQMRFEFFNLFNLHQFIIPGGGNSNNAANVVNNDVSSPSFGIWAGAVTPPRTIQLGVKVIF